MFPQKEYRYVWYKCGKCGHRWYGPALDVSLKCPLDGASLIVDGPAERLCTDTVHIGPFVRTPEGKGKCTACGEEW